MRELSASEVLSIWERGRSRSLPERALELLAAAGHPEPHGLPVGERDAALVELRVLTFGPALEAVVDCPSCGERLEVELTGAELRGAPAAAGSIELVAGDRWLRLRLPTAADLVAVAASAGPAEGRRLLLERVVSGGGDLDPALEAAVVERLAEGDPGAWIELSLECPACGEAWSAPFDIVSFLWAELEAYARRLVGDVHALASAYGWTEGEVLALGRARREAYLELVGT